MFGPRRTRHLGALDRIALVAALSLAAFTIMTVARQVDAIAAPGLDIALDTATSVIALAIAILALARFRTRGDAMALSEGVAFTVLSIVSIASIGPRLGGPIPMPVSDLPSTQATFYMNVVAQTVTAGLLVAGAVATLRGSDRRAGLGMGVPLAIVGLLAIGLLLDTNAPPVSVTTSIRAIPKLASAALFIVAMLVARRVYRRHHRIGDAYLVVAIVFAAFAEIHSAFDLDTGPGLVTTTDILRLTFDAILLAGLVVTVRASSAALRETNRELERLNDTEFERVALEERARLARELHDGVAQNLWIAKLTVGRLSGLEGLDPEVKDLSDGLATAIDAGLAEAHQAVMALRARGTGSFSENLRDYVDEFADSFSLRTEFRCDGDLPRLRPRAEAELLRIAQEALSNARRHADATLIRVAAGVSGDLLRLAVTDNGRGFDLTSARKGAFGIVGMRERAALIGGTIAIESQPRNGTTVTLTVPMAAVVAEPRAGS